VTLVGIVVVVVGLGVADTLVWYPMAAVPGMSLAEIRAGVAAAGETDSDAAIAVWALFWLVASLVTLAMSRWSRLALWQSPNLRTMVGGLVVLGAAFTEWWASFGIKMGLGDSLAGHGGVFTPTDPILTMIGAIALTVALRAGLTSRRAATAHATGSATSTGI